MEPHPNLRALNVLRDLPQVADLIELCFSHTMDDDGQRYVRDMRRAGRDSNFLNWAIGIGETASLPLSGYIWEENGRIVGNASLVPFHHRKQRIYLIANVAVHPDHRRRGIARALTERAVRHARQRKIASLWLHVRDDNPGAIQLYSDLGFEERARRTTWSAPGDSEFKLVNDNITVTTRLPRFWAQQLEWLRRNYPDELAWHRPWNFGMLRPGVWNWLTQLFLDTTVQQWAAVAGEQLEAVLTWIPGGYEASLYAALDARSDPRGLTALLSRVRRELAYRKHIPLELPAGQFETAIQAAGFKPDRTLIWMRAEVATLPA